VRGTSCEFFSSVNWRYADSRFYDSGASRRIKVLARKHKTVSAGTFKRANNLISRVSGLFSSRFLKSKLLSAVNAQELLTSTVLTSDFPVTRVLLLQRSTETNLDS
jgi:hypothetical protein